MSYTGKWLHINLSTGKYEINDSDKDLFKKYIGGKGLGFAILDEIAPNPDPFGTENPLIFVNGPFTGSKVQTSARTTLVSRSPLTGSIHDSHCGGHFGPALKRAGFDYMIIDGKSDKPVYLFVTDEKIEILDASEYWGKGIFFTNDKLKELHQGRCRIAAIGQAGENLSKIACIGVDKWRQFGRGGLGAVMGSKNLKAIVVDGNQKIKYFDEEKFNELNKQLTKDIVTNDSVLFRREKGTMKCIRSGQEDKWLPTKNWQECEFDEFEGITSETCREELNWKDVGCYNCGILCSKIAKWDDHEVEGPEYETTAFLGSGCLISSSKDVAWANELCDDLGMDTISAGVTCSFAMECFEKGLIDDWSGIKLKWGSAVAQRELLNKMAYRNGIGETFADGTKIAARKIGKNSADFAINIHGMELSGVNLKGAFTMAVVLSVADFASHTRLWCVDVDMGPDYKIEDVPSTIADGMDEINARNSLVICDFVPYGFDRLAPVLNAATGFDFSQEDLMKLGTKITHLARRYNIRNGRKHTDDTLPRRFFDEKSISGLMAGKKIDREFFKSVIQKYYSLRGWNEKGIPTDETLKKYGL